MTVKMVSLKIDNQTVTVPQDSLVVDAAKKIGIDIPVFCYHPKMEPVGMCRMCLVSIGRPVVDRETRQIQLEADGSPKISFSPKMETACTTPVSEGMVVVTNSAPVAEARKDVLEFLLTSHPLDCPVCDKGGECPLQNLTMGFGPGESRFEFDEKMHLAKHVPLGELIYLDRERCIQCARCVRFQSEVVDDPVIGFSQRGRALEIMTHSKPGFDSIFSGNTTDICPVGALTTSDFRFGARPWEMKPVASICNHCPVGCNITLNVRREAKAGGKSVIKRVMPRQNEQVNEIWICDKARFAYHYTESSERLQKPMVRKNGELVEVSWEEALDKAAEALKAAGAGLVTLAGGRLANEDLFNLYEFTYAQNGAPVLYSYMAGGDLVAQVGVGQGTNFSDMGPETTILVIASDLHQEAPVWWLRVKQAADRGAKLIVANPRGTRLDKHAAHVLRYEYGQEASVLSSFMPGSADGNDEVRAAARAFAEAQNAVILYGSEGLGLSGSQALAHSAADLLVKTKHVGRANNGLLAVWHNGNAQGAWDMGFRPSAELPSSLAGAGAVLCAAADPAGDDPALAAALGQARFVIVQELFMTKTARLADVVLPVQALTEREGTYTSGERRVQRFYPAVFSDGKGPRADFSVAAQLAERLGMALEGRAASLAFLQIAKKHAAYQNLSYQQLSEVVEQWPVIGRSDLYYGGTGYDNHQGLGVQLLSAVERGEVLNFQAVSQIAGQLPAGELLLVPVTRLYDHGQTVVPSYLLDGRLAGQTVQMHPTTAQKLGCKENEKAVLTFNGHRAEVKVVFDESVPAGVGLIARSVGLPVFEPIAAQIKR